MSLAFYHDGDGEMNGIYQGPTPQRDVSAHDKITSILKLSCDMHTSLGCVAPVI